MEIDLFQGEIDVSLHVVPDPQLTTTQAQLIKLFAEQVQVVEDSAGVFLLQLINFTGQFVVTRRQYLEMQILQQQQQQQQEESDQLIAVAGSELNTVKEEDSSLEASMNDLNHDVKPEELQHSEMLEELQKAHMSMILENPAVETVETSSDEEDNEPNCLRQDSIAELISSSSDGEESEGENKEAGLEEDRSEGRSEEESLQGQESFAVDSSQRSSDAFQNSAALASAVERSPVNQRASSLRTLSPAGSPKKRLSQVRFEIPNEVVDCDEDSLSSSSHPDIQLRSRGSMLPPVSSIRSLHDQPEENQPVYMSPQTRARALAMMRGQGRLKLDRLNSDDSGESFPGVRRRDSNDSYEATAIKTESTRSADSSDDYFEDNMGSEDGDGEHTQGDLPKTKRKKIRVRKTFKKATSALRASNLPSIPSIPVLPNLPQLPRRSESSRSLQSDLDGRSGHSASGFLGMVDRSVPLRQPSWTPIASVSAGVTAPIAATSNVARALGKGSLAAVNITRKGGIELFELSRRGGVELIEKSKRGGNVLLEKSKSSLSGLHDRLPGMAGMPLSSLQGAAGLLTQPRWGRVFGMSKYDKKNSNGARSSRRSSLRTDASGAADYEAPTRLHELCRQPDVTLAELEDELDRAPYAVSVRDSRGRLPLHILGDNDELVSNPLGKLAATTFSRQLMRAYPEGITSLDDEGCMPFVAILQDWHNWIYESHRKQKDSAHGNPVKSVTKGAKGLLGAWDDLTCDISSAVTKTAKDQQSDESILVPGSKIGSVLGISTRSFPPVDVWEEVEWSLEMLSHAMDELGGKGGAGHKPSRRQLINPHGHNQEARTDLATHIITTMPTILKTLLLVEDEGEDTRKKLFKTQIVRRMLLCPGRIFSFVVCHLLLLFPDYSPTSLFPF